jgi:hypothetical protein
MITTLSIISLDQGKIWRAAPDEDVRAADEPQAAEAPVGKGRRTWAWIAARLLTRPRPA